MGLCCPVFGQGRICNDMASNKRRRHTPDQIIRRFAEEVVPQVRDMVGSHEG